MINFQDVMRGVTAEEAQTEAGYQAGKDCLAMLKSTEEQFDGMGSKITIVNCAMGAVVVGSVALAAWSVKKTFF